MEKLTTAAAAIAGRIGLGVLAIEPLDLGRLEHGTWQGHDLTSYSSCRFEFEDDGSLALHVEGAHFLFSDESDEVGIELRTTTGTIRSRSAYLGRRAFGTSGTAATLYLDEWEWDSGVAAVAWVGSVEGARVGIGDLSVSFQGGYSQKGQHFLGAGLRWFIWDTRTEHRGRRRHDRVDAVLEVLDGELSARRVGESIGIAGFVLGSHLRLTRLLGITAEGCVVRAIGVETGARPTARIRRPLLDAHEAIGLHGEFFSLIADAAARDSEADVTFLATVAYLDALAGHLDGGYLAAQVALEAFVSAVSRRGVPSARVESDGSRVHDKEAWLRWVEANEAEIGSMARDARSRDVLLNVLRGAWRESTSRAVENFFEREGLPLPTAILDEVRRRNHVAHRLIMSSNTPERDLEEDLRRLSTIQSLLVAALAMFVGYRGPIAGGIHGDEVPDWWPHRTDASQRRFFRIPLDEIEGER